MITINDGGDRQGYFSEMSISKIIRALVSFLGQREAKSDLLGGPGLQLPSVLSGVDGSGSHSKIRRTNFCAHLFGSGMHSEVSRRITILQTSVSLGIMQNKK